MLRECLQSESIHVVGIHMQLDLARCLTATFRFPSTFTQGLDAVTGPFVAVRQSRAVSSNAP